MIAAQENGKPVDHRSVHAPQGTVFVVDDDPHAREAHESLVRSVGLPVESFSSAHEFLAAFAPDRSGCLVLDVRLPGMSGLELQEQLNTLGADLPVIVVSAYGDVPTVVRAMRSGAFDFLSKPFDPQSLLERIQEALAKAAEQNEVRAIRAQVAARWATLSVREQQVADLLVDGKTTKEIASALSISPKTVDNHRAKLLEKMRAENPVVLRKLLFP